MIDGGGATKANTLGVHGDHYVATLDTRYPDLAYEPFVEGGGRGRWKWDQQRPRFIGEDWYATGINPADYAMWGGEVAFQGKAATRDAVALIYRMLNEGYRWGGHYAAWHFWLGGDGGPAQWGANDPRAVFVRQWDWTFGSGQSIKRTFGIFNDTQYPDPITFTRRLTIDGQRSLHQEHDPSRRARYGGEIRRRRSPCRRSHERKEAALHLVLSVEGQRDLSATRRRSRCFRSRPPAAISAVALAVFDPAGQTAAWLQRLGVPLRHQSPRSTRFRQMPRSCWSGATPSGKIKAPRLSWRSMPRRDDRSSCWISPTRSSTRPFPPRCKLAPRTKKSDFGEEIPAADGCTAFIEDSSHPAFEGLQNKDFFTWGPDHLVFRNAYLKPTRGAKSLVQCGPRLEYSALVEVPSARGDVPEPTGHRRQTGRECRRAAVAAESDPRRPGLPLGVRRRGHRDQRSIAGQSRGCHRSAVFQGGGSRGGDSG